MILISSWNREGPLVHWDLIEQGRTVNAEVCREQFELCLRALDRHRLPVISLRDNARPRVAPRTRAKLHATGWEWLKYSPTRRTCRRQIITYTTLQSIICAIKDLRVLKQFTRI